MPVDRAVQSPTLVDRVTDDLFQRIVSGSLEPGERLTEEGVAAGLGVSRTPVREAVKRLAEMGLLVVRPRSGLEVVAVSEKDVREVTDLRRELEAFALRLAMARLTAADVRKLEQIQAGCEKLLDAGHRLAVFREDSRLHLAIAGMSGNRHLADMLRRLDAKVQLCRMFMCLDDGKVAVDVRFHRRILAAMKREDAARAEALLREHIDWICEQGDAG